MDFASFLLATFGLLVLIVGYRVFFTKSFYFTSFHSETRDINIGSGAIEKKIAEAMEKSDFRNVKVNNSKFRGFSTFSLSSWSEVIEVDYTKINDHQTNIICTSTCYFPLQIYDWGKNKRNTTTFFKKLEMSAN